jgi:hypothetical protein
MERVIRWKKEILDCRRRPGSDRRSWLDYGLVFLAYCLLVGCTTLKKAGIVGLAAGAGATAGTVLSGGVAAPILGATTTAFVADAVTEATSIGSGNMSECVTGFWPLLGQVIETGGWLIAGVILVPLVMGFLIPNGLERKRKRRT